jgi:hypothetical protein
MTTTSKTTKMRETAKHHDAFEAWYENARNFRITAEKCSVSERSLFIWAGAFDWHERAHVRDAEVKRVADAEAVQARADRARRRRQAAELLTARGVEWLRTYKIENAKDAIMAIKIGIEIERKEDGIPDWVMLILNASPDDLAAIEQQLSSPVAVGEFEPSLADTDELEP